MSFLLLTCLLLFSLKPPYLVPLSQQTVFLHANQVRLDEHGEKQGCETRGTRHDVRQSIESQLLPPPMSTLDEKAMIRMQATGNALHSFNEYVVFQQS